MILFSFYFPFIFLPLFYLHRVTEREEPERSFPESKVPHGRLTLTNRKSIRKAREGLFFLSNLSVIFCVT